MTPTSSRPVARGFTLIEAMILLVIVGILGSIAAWSMQSMMAGNRVAAASRGVILHVRQAAAIAARINAPVDLVFYGAGESGCVPRYELIRVSDNTVYDSVCLPTEYPGVVLGGGVTGTTVSCTADETLLPNCSLCSGKKSIRVFPSGEVSTSGTSTTGDSIVFSSARFPSKVTAIGVTNLSGKTRVYQPDDANENWVCP